MGSYMKTLEQIVESEKYIPMTYLDYQLTSYICIHITQKQQVFTAN
ncbi:hypothetical protein SDC9_58888 [bioreactor metagenome]|uniref:Uncharacterized protein n=1 Tax=bioreactor metagenome TaxID=1076179 RepID=A0A644X8N5_9ZZZZ